MSNEAAEEEAAEMESLLLFPDLSLALEEEETEEREVNPSSSGGEWQQHHHLRSIGATISIRQLPSRGLSFQLWPAAASLVSLLDTDASPLLLPKSSSPLRILELGSGTGLAGIAAAALIGADVTLTDLPHVVPNLLFNAQANVAAANARGGSLTVRSLAWGDDKCEWVEPPFDAVVASDVVYYDHLFDPLLQTLRRFVRGETAFLMAHLRRWKKKDALFFRKARKVFDVAAVHTDPPLPGSRVGVVIFRFKLIVLQCCTLPQLGIGKHAPMKSGLKGSFSNGSPSGCGMIVASSIIPIVNIVSTSRFPSSKL